MVRKRKPRDVLDLTNRVFPYPHDFLEAFPQLSGGTIEYSQTGPRGTLGYPSRAHSEYVQESSLEAAFPIIACDHAPVCRRGGFELRHQISLMMIDRRVQGEYELKCAGFTGTLRPHRAKPCGNTLRCRITLAYKTSAGPA